MFSGCYECGTEMGESSARRACKLFGDWLKAFALIASVGNWVVIMSNKDRSRPFKIAYISLILGGTRLARRRNEATCANST